MNIHIDSDIAHAIVNYVDRKEGDYRNWGLIDATGLRTFIVENTTAHNTISCQELHTFLDESTSGKMAAGFDNKLEYYRELIRRVRKFDK